MNFCGNLTKDGECRGAFFVKPVFLRIGRLLTIYGPEMVYAPDGADPKSLDIKEINVFGNITEVPYARCSRETDIEKQKECGGYFNPSAVE